MKKMLVIPAVLLLLATASAESRFFLAVGANMLRPADADYRQVYGSRAIYPDLSATVRILGGLCLTGSAGRFSKSGTTPELGLEARSTQSYFSFGLGYLLRATPLLCFEAGAGIAGLGYREEALGAWVKGRHRGIFVEGSALFVPEDEILFFGLKVSYLSARVDDLNLDMTGPQPIRLGGAKIALYIGIQLFGPN